MPIYWTQFDWPSFATLAAGAMAVCAAVFVGLKQTKITERQTRISEKQNEILARENELAELTLRHELFDRRHAVYETISKSLGEIVREGRAPPLNEFYAFLSAMNISKFLFAPSVFEGLERIWHRISEYRATQLQNDIARKKNTISVAAEDKESELFEEIILDLEGLADLFGDDLRLGN